MSTTTASFQLPAHIQHWADEQVKFEASGLTIREFCRQNQLGISGFYKRRALVRELGYPGLKGRRTDQSKSFSTSTPAGFVDVGVLEPNRRNNNPGGDTEMALAAAAVTSSDGLRQQDKAPDRSVEVRIDLGLGVVLTIVRH